MLGAVAAIKLAEGGADGGRILVGVGSFVHPRGGPK
jgi:hypothetical protein